MNTPINRTMMYALVVTLIVMLGVGVNSIVYADRVQRQSEQKWCDLVKTMDGAYSANPPTTPTGLRMANDIRMLKEEFGC